MNAVCLQGLAVACLLLLPGCSRHIQYRTQYAPCDSRSAPCSEAAIEQTDSYDLAFVEFDDQGWLWSREQFRRVLDYVKAQEANQRLFIVTFVHGWKHNARHDDNNVNKLRKILADINKLENSAPGHEKSRRKVIGIYAGWRGKSYTLPFVKELSFWERKNTAHEVGRGALCELLLELENLRNRSQFDHRGDPQQTRFIVIGHSFGGAATYSAVAPILAERTLQTFDDQGRERHPKGFGDLVVLVNPAFEAARFGVLHDLVMNRTNSLANRATLAVFTSRKDLATRFAFPIGRRVSTLFDRYGGTNGFERAANTTAVGHFEPYRTHDLRATDTNVTNAAADRPGEAARIGRSVKRVFENKGKLQTSQAAPVNRPPHVPDPDDTFDFEGCKLVPSDPSARPLPLFVVSVDGKILPNHNALANPRFLDFLGEFIVTFTPGGESPAAVSAATLRDPR